MLPALRMVMPSGWCLASVSLSISSRIGVAPPVVTRPLGESRLSLRRRRNGPFITSVKSIFYTQQHGWRLY